MIDFEIPKNYTNSPSSYSNYGTPQVTINKDATLDLDSSNAFEGVFQSGGVDQANSRKGPEKLLEVWFSASADSLTSKAPQGLKAVPSETWKDMLDLVNCKILSIVESEPVDAYLLSESSMFVFPHKLILKTCGTTTLLCGLPQILEVAAIDAGFPHVVGDLVNGVPTAASPYRVFYSRKNFLFPDRQKGPHRSWRDEVKSLDKLFLGGSAYMIGKMNGEHWYLYLTEPNTLLTPPSTPDRSETETKYLEVPVRPTRGDGDDVEAQDETLEMLMTDLDEGQAQQWYLDHASAVAEGRYYQRVHRARAEAINNLGTIPEAPEDDAAYDVFSHTSSENGPLGPAASLPEELSTEGHALGTVVAEASGLTDLYPAHTYPDARVDAYLFTPCGFSANGVVPAPPPTDHCARVGGARAPAHYFTVHVTPEPQCSYASFETNVPAGQSGPATADLVRQVVRIFRPGRFTVTLFEAKGGGAARGAETAGLERQALLQARSKMDAIEGYRRVDRIVHDLDGYDLVFRYYERLGWEGGAPRIGEVL